MSSSIPNGGHAVMAQRREPLDSLELFPTPPWATRALLEHVIGDVRGGIAWEPACGLRHMSDVLRERFGKVIASDVFDYGGHDVGSFVGTGPDVIETPRPAPHWIIFNPPFSLGVEFVERALRDAREGVACLVRTQWLEGEERYTRLFRDAPPTIFAPFVERVPMVKGRWDPQASTATAYAWFIWRRLPLLPGQSGLGSWGQNTSVVWIPPGCRKRLTKSDDVQRFAARGSA